MHHTLYYSMLGIAIVMFLALVGSVAYDGIRRYKEKRLNARTSHFTIAFKDENGDEWFWDSFSRGGKPTREVSASARTYEENAVVIKVLMEAYPPTFPEGFSYGPYVRRVLKDEIDGCCK